MPYLEANGERLYYEIAGEGPAILFLHSLGSSSHAWRGQMEFFKSEFQVIAVDRRGHGRSSHRGQITIDTGVDDAVALLDSLDIEAVHIVGLSMGGTEALRFYERYPQRLHSLILCDTFAVPPPGSGEARLADIQDKLNRMDMAAYGRLYAQGTLQPHTPENVRAELVRVIGSMSPRSYMAAAEAVFRADVSHVPPLVEVPTLVIAGEKDERTTPEVMREQLASRIRGAQFKVISDAGHLVNLDQPEAFNQTVKSFLTRLGEA